MDFPLKKRALGQTGCHRLLCLRACEIHLELVARTQTQQLKQKGVAGFRQRLIEQRLDQFLSEEKLKFAVDLASRHLNLERFSRL